MYYLEQRPISEMMQIRRRSLLPDYVIGTVRAELGSIVDIRETVARGFVPAPYHIIEAARDLRLNAREDVGDLLLVEMHEPVAKGQIIAGKDPERGRRIKAPMDGWVVDVKDGRIIMQALPEEIDLEAGVRGQVVHVLEGRGVVIQAKGGVIQGIWGNDRHVIAALHLEPEDGIETISVDDLDTRYRGDIVVTKTKLTAAKIDTALAQSFAGIIAPSMDAELIAKALDSDLAIMITTGFGDVSYRRQTWQILETYEGFQAVLDAALPQRFDDRRAELMINHMSKEALDPQGHASLQVGTMIRITREPYAGRMGRVVALPQQPVRLANGLRVLVAEIDVGAGELVDVPLVNLEFAGT